MAKKEKIMDKDIDFESIRSLIKKEWFIILIIFLFSLGLHIAYKNAGLFHFDSAIDVRTIENTVETGSLQYSYGWGAPAMIVIVGFFFLLDKLIFGAVSAETAYFFVT
ncbi:MAG: hypothetical protein KKE20_00005, partial [Nanoarchaeota archaeon]|nr:hypothetical protein [Nanoarchaeota archaeon]